MPTKLVHNQYLVYSTRFNSFLQSWGKGTLKTFFRRKGKKKKTRDRETRSMSESKLEAF